MTLLHALQTHYKSLNLNPSKSNEINSFDSELKEVNEVLKTPQERPFLFPLGQLGLLQFSGPEAVDFLQKQLTNDLLKLPDDAACQAAWCSAKGRMLASFIAYRFPAHETTEEPSTVGPTVRLIVSRDLAEPTLKRMQMFILRSKVKAQDSSNAVEVFGLAGEKAEALLASLNLDCRASSPPQLACRHTTDGITAIRLPTHLPTTETSCQPRFLLIVPAALAVNLWQKLEIHCVPAGVTAWQALDIQNSFPMVTEATREAFVPQMVDFDLLGGVSFKKGCYPGQEIVSRTHYLGKVKRHLYRVTSEVQALHAGMELHSPESPDQAVGTLVSAVQCAENQWIGLASILESHSGNLTHDIQAVRVFGEAPEQQ